MTWFLRLKLAHKLLLTFLTCSLLTAAVGLYGLWRVTDLGRMLDNTYTDMVLPAQDVSEAAARLSAHSRAYVRLPALKDPAEVKDAVGRAKVHLDKFHKAIEAYRATSMSAKEKELLAQLEAQLPNYLAQNDKVADLAISGNSEAAAALSNGDARKAINNVEALFTSLIEELASQAKATNADGARALENARLVLLGVIAASVVMAIALGMMVTRVISRQLGGEPSEAAALMRRVADGDLSADIRLRSGDDSSMLYAARQMVGRLTQVIEGQRKVVEAANRGDFAARIDTTGLQGFQKEMGDGLNALVTTTGGSIQDVVRVMGALSGGDLAQTIDKPYLGAFGEMKTYVNDTVARLSQVVAEVNSGAEALASASEEVSATAQSLSQASSEQAAGVEETSASMEQMTASISQNTENAKITDGMATKAAAEASEGGEAVKATVAAMMPIFCAICFIATTVARTASPPSLASLAALVAMPSVTFAFSVFCAIEAVICSIDALVSSTPAACSLEACDKDCAVALTSSDAPASDSAPPFTSATTCESFAIMFCIAISSCPVSSRPRASICTVRSPSARRFAASTATPSGRVTLRVSSQAVKAPRAKASEPSSIISLRAWA